jgi:hypothetical protein
VLTKLLQSQKLCNHIFNSEVLKLYCCLFFLDGVLWDIVLYIFVYMLRDKSFKVHTLKETQIFCNECFLPMIEHKKNRDMTTTIEVES